MRTRAAVLRRIGLPHPYSQSKPLYTEIGLDGGHVGVFVSGKSQGVLGKGIVDWLKKRDRGASSMP
jgi:hypothetical protein